MLNFHFVTVGESEYVLLSETSREIKHENKMVPLQNTFSTVREKNRDKQFQRLDEKNVGWQKMPWKTNTMSEKGTRVCGWWVIIIVRILSTFESNSRAFCCENWEQVFFRIVGHDRRVWGGACVTINFFFCFCTHAIRNSEKWSRMRGALYSYTCSVLRRKFECCESGGGEF